MPSIALPEFERLVLLAALRLGPEEAYSVSIADQLRRDTGRGIRRARVFVALQRLETGGLVSTRLGEPRADRGGRPRRLVTLEPDGLAALRRATAPIEATTAGLDDVIGDAR